MDALKAKIDRKAQHAEQDVRDHLDRLQRRMEHDRLKVTATQSEVKEWVDARKLATSDKIAEWKANRDTTKLQNRADHAERYDAAG